jgi:hypothetical protein
MARRAE